MRKRSIICLFDKGFWFLVSILPLVAFVIMLWFNGQDGITLSSAISSCGFDISSDNLILSSLIDLFGSAGVMPLFVSADLLVYLTYFIIVNLVHLAVDTLLFIPRFAHKLLDGDFSHE